MTFGRHYFFDDNFYSYERSTVFPITSRYLLFGCCSLNFINVVLTLLEYLDSPLSTAIKSGNSCSGAEKITSPLESNDIASIAESKETTSSAEFKWVNEEPWFYITRRERVQQLASQFSTVSLEIWPVNQHSRINEQPCFIICLCTFEPCR